MGSGTFLRIVLFGPRACAAGRRSSLTYRYECCPRCFKLMLNVEKLNTDSEASAKGGGRRDCQSFELISSNQQIVS